MQRLASFLPRLARLPLPSLLALLALLAPSVLGCSPSASAGDAGLDGSVPFVDVCDAFTGVGTACPLASPVRCFPACEASGCFCTATEAGPTWVCQTDLTCVPDCGPLDDGCASP